MVVDLETRVVRLRNLGLSNDQIKKSLDASTLKKIKTKAALRQETFDNWIDSTYSNSSQYKVASHAKRQIFGTSKGRIITPDDNLAKTLIASVDAGNTELQAIEDVRTNSQEYGLEKRPSLRSSLNDLLATVQDAHSSLIPYESVDPARKDFREVRDRLNAEMKRREKTVLYDAIHKLKANGKTEQQIAEALTKKYKFIVTSHLVRKAVKDSNDFYIDTIAEHLVATSPTSNSLDDARARFYDKVTGLFKSGKTDEEIAGYLKQKLDVSIDFQTKRGKKHQYHIQYSADLVKAIRKKASREAKDERDRKAWVFLHKTPSVNNLARESAYVHKSGYLESKIDITKDVNRLMQEDFTDQAINLVRTMTGRNNVSEKALKSIERYSQIYATIWQAADQLSISNGRKYTIDECITSMAHDAARIYSRFRQTKTSSESNKVAADYLNDHYARGEYRFNTKHVVALKEIAKYGLPKAPEPERGHEEESHDSDTSISDYTLPSQEISEAARVVELREGDVERIVHEEDAGPETRMMPLAMGGLRGGRIRRIYTKACIAAGNLLTYNDNDKYRVMKVGKIAVNTGIIGSLLAVGSAVTYRILAK